MLRSHRCGRDASCRMAEIEPTVERGGCVFSALGAMSAEFGGHYTVTRRLDSS